LLEVNFTGGANEVGLLLLVGGGWNYRKKTQQQQQNMKDTN